MANSLNKVTLIGNVGQDPQVRQSQDGRENAQLSLATSESWKDKITGEKKEKVEWHKIVIFSPALVTIAKNYVKKGSKLYIEGALQTRKWTDSSGAEKWTTEIVLQAYNGVIVLLDSKGHDDGSYRDNHSSKGSTPNTPTIVVDDDEIPF